jgi:hypothetical protein
MVSRTREIIKTNQEPTRGVGGESGNALFSVASTYLLFSLLSWMTMLLSSMNEENDNAHW